MSTNQAQPPTGSTAQQPPTQQQVSPQPPGQQASTPPQPKKATWTGFAGKTLWDWLNLIAILLVPLMIGVFTLAITIQQNQTSQRQYESDQKIADDQQQSATLKAYFDNITDLMLNHGLQKAHPNDGIAIIARAQTLTTVRGLNGDRKGALIRFLYEANLIGSGRLVQGSLVSYPAIVSLADADLSKANLYEADLREADLEAADLRGADLRGADLRGADLIGTHATPDQLAPARYLKGAKLPDGSTYPSQSYLISNHTEP